MDPPPPRIGSQAFEEQVHLAAANISEVDSVNVESYWCQEPAAVAEMNCHCFGDPRQQTNEIKVFLYFCPPVSLSLLPLVGRI